jgi:hypothetical protein
VGQWDKASKHAGLVVPPHVFRWGWLGGPTEKPTKLGAFAARCRHLTHLLAHGSRLALLP